MIANNSMDATTSWGDNDSTDSANSWGDNSSVQCAYTEKLYEDDLWVDYLGEWRKYLKALWLEVLKLKHYFTLRQYSRCRLYYRRLMIPISGWLARKGYNKKN